MSPVVIVVPVYKKELSASEKISLDRLYKTLGKYPIVFVAPAKLSDYLKCKGYVVESFHDEFFKDILSYSKMLLTPDFYRRFSTYEYMLIHQLDAFVFSDQLIKWCDKGYDFIGAPMPRIWWPNLTKHPWNGGLSLRKVSSFIQVTKIREEIFSISGRKSEFERYEDAFFSYCGEHKNIDFSVPTFNEGKLFSLQANIGHCYSKLKIQNLPFACHGWNKPHYFPFWRKYIEYFSGQLDAVEAEVNNSQGWSYDEQRRKFIDCYYLMPRIMRNNPSEAYDVFARLYQIDAKYVLWGYGFWGRDAVDFFRYIGVKLKIIFDIKANNNDTVDGIPKMIPDLNLIKSSGYKVIIATDKYEKEIASQLIAIGMKKDIDYCDFITLKKNFINEYYKGICGRMFLSKNVNWEDNI
ncbi:MAG: hypothetical protein J6M62_03950 [Selenomonadaceae bacterium]|nr:hypothetical protein [Selenomonadaceae bacterium]